MRKPLEKSLDSCCGITKAKRNRFSNNSVFLPRSASLDYHRLRSSLLHSRLQSVSFMTSANALHIHLFMYMVLLGRGLFAVVVRLVETLTAKSFKGLVHVLEVPIKTIALI